jgi:hypothetical protein
MAHWAEIDESNIVLRVIVTNNDDPNGDEGYQWLLDNLGGQWIKTSYNTALNVHTLGGTPLRKNYAAIGYFYDSILDAFIAPKPEDYIDNGVTYTAVLNEETGAWNMVVSE